MNFVKAPNKVHAIDIERALADYGDSIFRMCYVYLRDMHLAEDAVQETFMKAFKNHATFRHGSSVKTWLMRIAINTCKDMQRSAWFRRVDRKIALDELPEPVCQSDPADDTLILEVMRLPQKFKAVILLRYYQEMSMCEISEALGIPIGTVATRLAAAKKKLYANLERWYFDE